MTTYTAKVTTAQYARFCLKLGQKFMPTVQKGILSGALRSLSVVRGNVQKAPPASPRGSVGAVNTRHYERAWKAARTAGGAVIFNDSPYAAIIELGRRPGAKMPPKGTLEPWLRHKLHMTASEAQGAAFVVARAIAKRGLFGRHVLRSSIPDVLKAVDIEITNELQKECSKTS